MKILYPNNFTLDNLSDVHLPSGFRGGLEWGESAVIVENVDDTTFLLIKQAIYESVSEPFDATEENKVIQKRAKVKQWLKNNPGVVSFLKSTPAQQKNDIEAMTSQQRWELVWYLTVFCSALLRELLED